MPINTAGSAAPSSRVRNVPQRQEEVTVLATGVQHNLRQRPSSNAINKSRAEVYGTVDQVLMHVVTQSGEAKTVIVKSFSNREGGGLLFVGVIANGSKLTTVHGSLFGDNDGWMMLDRTL